MFMKDRNKKEEKYLTETKFDSFEKTFEKFQDFTAFQFKKVFEKLDQHSKVLETMLEEMKKYSDEAREHRMTI